MTTNSDAPPSCKVVLAGAVAKKLLSEVSENLQKLSQPPILVGFLANKDPAARMYADWTGRTCRENGFAFQLREVDREDLDEHLRSANKDPGIHGVIVYYPVFNSRRDQTLQWILDSSKDVEGLCPQLIQNMYQNVRFLDPPRNTQKSILPCTPLAIIKTLEHLQIYNTFLDYGKRLFGRRITVINRSEVVGRPLAALLANDGAEVYSVDVTGVQCYSRGTGLRKEQHHVSDMEGWTLGDCLAKSDVVISGVPGASFKVPTYLIREGAVCINFSSEKNFTPDVKEKASIYVPAIGKVTIVVLLRNLLRLVQNQSEKQAKAAEPVEQAGTVENGATSGQE
ncbi:Methylenetetrahydrofolate dehydrogenase [NAD(+)] [Elasticomyces elasticus]|nr:Methylenetetrahydrofolate dehydrogenase [NAD(+)] [Elasticomyces elasticus]